MSRELDVQRDITRIALGRTGGEDGFALAGSGAIREHGIIDRPTQDVDLFTTSAHLKRVDKSAERVQEDLRAAGYTVTVDRMSPEFARLNVRSADGYSTEVDFGIDWRRNAPVVLDVGPVLGLEDAVGSKTIAVYSRGEARDFLDLDAIRVAGSFSDDDLLEAATQRDPGFAREIFVGQLELVRRITIEEVQDYGVGTDQLAAIKDRLTDWAANIRATATRDLPGKATEAPRATSSRQATDALGALNKLAERQEKLHRAEQKPQSQDPPVLGTGRTDQNGSGRSL